MSLSSSRSDHPWRRFGRVLVASAALRLCGAAQPRPAARARLAKSLSMAYGKRSPDTRIALSAIAHSSAMAPQPRGGDASRRPWLAVLGGPARSASMYRLVNAAAEARRHPAKYARYRFKQPSIARSLRRPWLAILGRPARSASMPRLVNARSRCPWASAAAFTNPCTARR